MELTKDNIKNISIEENAICILTDKGVVGKEYFSNYSSLKNASIAQRSNYMVSKYGIHWIELDEDLSFDGFFQTKPEPNAVAKVFEPLNEINVSAFARRMGIPQSLMAAYLNGAKTPSNARKKAIEKELHQLGKELLEIHI